jgi:hypothetical protein
MATSRPIRKVLLVSGLLVAGGTTAFWAAKGAHRGWSQHRVPHKQIDEVTGLEQITYEDRYVPGIEVLAGGVGLGVALAALSLFFHKPKTATNP